VRVRVRVRVRVQVQVQVRVRVRVRVMVQARVQARVMVQVPALVQVSGLVLVLVPAQVPAQVLAPPMPQMGTVATLRQPGIRLPRRTHHHKPSAKRPPRSRPKVCTSRYVPNQMALHGACLVVRQRSDANREIIPEQVDRYVTSGGNRAARLQPVAAWANRL
jgi:hypothetical protein